MIDGSSAISSSWPATVCGEHDAPAEYGPHKTIYNRSIRWSGVGVFNRIFAALAAKGRKPDELLIDATHLKLSHNRKPAQMALRSEEHKSDLQSLMRISY